MDWLTRIAMSEAPWWVVALLMLLMIVLTKGVDALRNIRRDKHAHDDAFITRLTIRVDTLESRLDKEQTAHMECIRRTGALEGQVAQLTKDMDLIVSRHDRKNTEQIEQTKKDIEHVKSQIGIQEPKTGDA